MDQSEEAAFTIVENLWKKSFDISKNAGDPLFSLYTKSFETIMVYMTQSLDYEYIEKEICSLDKDRQLALQSENGYDAHRCLSFGLIEAVQMMMKKNTKKLEEMIKQGFIPVPEVPKFPLEPKEEENMDDPEQIPADNETQEIIEQPIDEFSQDFPSDSQTSPLALIEQNYHLKEEEIMDDVNAGVDDFALEVDNKLNESPLEDYIVNEAGGTNQTVNQGRKSTRRISRSVKSNSMNDSDEEEVEPMMKKTRLDSEKKSGKDSPQVKCVLCEVYPKTVRDYVNHLNVYHKEKHTLNSNGIYLTCSCGKKIRSRTEDYRLHSECNGLGFTLHKLADEVYSTPKCVLCENYPTTPDKYCMHLTRSHNKSTLSQNGIYLICSCGYKVRSENRDSKHSKECHSLEFTLHKLEDEVHLNAQCVLCEARPTSIHAYATHMNKVHKSSLIANGVYLRCSCGCEVRSHYRDPIHNQKCDGLQFTLHKLEVPSTPQCILCESYPANTYAYTNHLMFMHKSTLNANDIYLMCACGFKVRSNNDSMRKHNKECDERTFSLHKNIDE